MKKIILIAMAIVTTFTTIAQNKKTNKPAADTAVHQKYSCPMHPDVTSNKPGKCPKCGMELNLSKKEKMKMDVMKMYSCPMHPDVMSDKAGKCPKCGMDLTVAKTKSPAKKH
jgi:uncharacterized paraquat-inducible protein A